METTVPPTGTDDMPETTAGKTVGAFPPDLASSTFPGNLHSIVDDLMRLYSESPSDTHHSPNSPRSSSRSHSPNSPRPSASNDENHGHSLSHNDTGLYSHMMGSYNEFNYPSEASLSSPEVWMSVPFRPGIASISLVSIGQGFENRVLQASVKLGDKRNTCTYAVDPELDKIMFLITRPWSVPGKGMIVAGCLVDFPNSHDGKLGTVVDSGEKTGVWVCRWSKEVVSDVVDILVEEDDCWFGMG